MNKIEEFWKCDDFSGEIRSLTDTSLMKWKYISSLKTRIYPQKFPNASAVTWSLVLQMRNLANKIEEFSKCDDFCGEISSAHR
jgi:hypothetical protein